MTLEAAEIARYRRKANNALGVLVICGMFFVETAVADHSEPNPMSAKVWTMLGLMSVVAILAWAWFRYRMRRLAAEADAGEERPAP